MSEYILILLFVYGSATPVAVLFPSKEACENAKTQAIAEFKRGQGVCVPRNVP
jgi:hypothetical protein